MLLTWLVCASLLAQGPLAALSAHLSNPFGNNIIKVRSQSHGAIQKPRADLAKWRCATLHTFRADCVASKCSAFLAGDLHGGTI